MKKLIYILAISLLLLSPFLGESIISFKDIFDLSSTNNIIFWELRVPRVFLAFFVGTILALSGLVFQVIFKNELITPYTLGIASGTTLFTAISIVFIPLIPLYISSIFGSLITIFYSL